MPGNLRRPLILALACALVAFSMPVPASVAQIFPDQGTPTAPMVARRFVVYIHSAFAQDDRAVQRVVARTGELVGVGLQGERRISTGGHVVRVDEGQSVDEALSRRIASVLAEQPGVESVEPDTGFVIGPAAVGDVITTREDMWPRQWNMFEPTGGINVIAAWEIAKGEGVVVAMLDSGITRHSDLDEQNVSGYDFITNARRARDGDGIDPNPNDEGSWADYPEFSPSFWHGTHTSGIVAARNDRNGTIGVAPEAKLSHIRLGGAGGIVSMIDVVDAIVWAAGGPVDGVPANGFPAHVLNMSIGAGGECGTSMQKAVDIALARGAVLVASAGNWNGDANDYRPANCKGVIAVAATNREGGKASYSNFGPTITIAAPGGEGTSFDGILSTFNAGLTVAEGEAYGSYSGTSMAAPHVAGVVALMLSAHPRLTPTQVKQALTSSARALPVPCPEGCGAGIVDARAALDAASRMAEPLSVDR
jgi:serine protease